MQAPRYLELYASGELTRRREVLYAKLSACNTCPRACGVNRFEKGNGFCRSTQLARVAQAKPHFGEEPCITGGTGKQMNFLVIKISACTGASDKGYCAVHADAIQ